MAVAAISAGLPVRGRPRVVAGTWMLVAGAFACYALLPEVRRLLQWRSGSFGISVLSAVPLAVTLLGILPLLYGRQLSRVDPAIRWLAWVWFGGFAYALAVALMQGNRFSSVYAFLDFCAPAVMGLWITTLDEPVELLYQRIARFLLWLAAPIALYGIVQFALLPPWDLAWMLNVRMPSIGPASPFDFRIFSTLNSPGPLGDFLMAVLLLNLPRLRRPTLLQVAQIAVCVAALGLTLVRSDWLALAAGLLCFVWLSPGRVRNLGILSAIVVACGVLFVGSALFLGNTQAQSALSARWDTFGSISSDSSYADRVAYFGGALQDALAHPAGQGLGVFGTAAQLGDGGRTIVFDNGYVARFTELGYFGMGTYVLTLAGGLLLAFKRRRAALVERRWLEAAIASSALALQVALIVLDLSSDHHNGFNGLFFWVPLGLLFAGRSAAACR